MAEKELEKSLTEYYICFVKTDNKFNELIQRVQRPLDSLKNEIQQLRLVSETSLDETDQCISDEFRGKLIFKINVAIEDEISTILTISSEINNACQGLKTKFDRLELARCKVNPNSLEMKKIMLGTPQTPRLDLLMQWSIDIILYYRELNATINRSVKNLDIKKEETVVNLMKSFEENKSKRLDINIILAFTQFMVKENLQNK